MKNLEIYNALKQPPKEALRSIQGGRLAGKTDINPQWRYKVMTEQFGPCGIGWKYEIVRVWNEPAGDGQIFAFAEVNVYIKKDDKWSDPIPGNGGSMLVEKEKAGLHATDEGYKMAITDALSAALKMLGVAADVYAGLWDGTKYSDTPQRSTGEIKGHWCSVHKTPFFKKGNMKAYAHPIKDEAGEDTGEWCYEHKEDTSESQDHSADPVDPKTMTFKDIGEFYTACLKHFKLAKSKVDDEIPEYDLANSEQRQKAWQQILAVYGH